jgi:peptidoglycan hydrolase-like protein with peptidoglycan-binding domain
MKTICFLIVLALSATYASTLCKWPLLKQGDRSRAVTTAQYLLTFHGLDPHGIDGIFGSGMSDSVRQFQRANGLSADGQIGANTWLALTVDTKVGDRGFQVSAVQDQLHSNYGYNGVTVDGIFGNGTDDAVRGFQRDNGEPVSGLVGQATWLGMLSGCNSTSGGGSSSGSGSANVTVQSAVDARGCSTAVCAGLSAQLVAQMNCLKSGLFVDVGTLRGPLSMSAAARAVPFLQTQAAEAMQRAIDSRGVALGLNSALRTLPQQLMLYEWKQASACGITAAAAPGRSNHQSGAAIDINDPYAWQAALEAQQWKKLGDFDRMHYDYVPAADVRSLSVTSFQLLWNKNNPADAITVDGIYGAGTESRMLRSPINGFPKSSC